MKTPRPPPPSSLKVSSVMKSNRPIDTMPEILLRRELRRIGIGGYRLQWKEVPGRPDIAYPGLTIAIFVNGCFWHRCPKCNLPIPKTNPEYWELKFKLNQERDEKKTNELEHMGWTVITVWECEINEDIEQVGNLIKRIVTTKRADQRISQQE